SPPARADDETVGLARTPGAGGIFVERALAVDHRIDDRPGGLDDVLTREERGVAGNGIAKQPLVVAEARLVAVLQRLPLVHDREFDRLAGHPFAGTLRARANRDHDL